MSERPWDRMPDLYAQKVSGGAWKPFRHLIHCANVATEAILSGEGRVIINMPPGHCKTDFFSWWLPTWALDNFAGKRVGLSSYQSDIAKQWGRRIRNEVGRNPLCLSKLTEDSKAAGQFHTNTGGSVYCTGVDGAMLGRRLDLAIVDDPHRGWDEAHSYEMRRKTLEWFKSTLESRMEPGGTIIVVGQRLHPDDLHGALRAEGGWKVVTLPAIAEQNDPLGRAPGEALCPERFTTEALERKRLSMGNARFGAMFQQAPTGAGTGRLYSRFSDRNVDPSLMLDAALPVHLSVDFNIRPGMHMEIGQHRELSGTFIVTDEIHEEAMDLNAALEAFEAWVRRHGGWKWGECHVFGDASGHARSVQVTRSCYDMIAQKLGAMRVPYRIRVPRQQPPIRDAVDALNDALLGMDGVCRYFVHPRCTRLIADFNELQRSSDGLIDKHDQKLSHASDAERYRLHMLKPAGGDQTERPRGRVYVGTVVG